MSKAAPVEMLAVTLNAQEIEANARALGKAYADKKVVEEELASAKTKAKASIESLDAQIAQRSRIALSGEEFRPVPVQYSKDFRRGTVTTIRLDSFAVVGSRPMTEAERQQEMFEKEAARADAAAGEERAPKKVKDSKKAKSSPESAAPIGRAKTVGTNASA